MVERREDVLRAVFSDSRVLEEQRQLEKGRFGAPAVAEVPEAAAYGREGALSHPLGDVDGRLVQAFDIDDVETTIKYDLTVQFHIVHFQHVPLKSSEAEDKDRVRADRGRCFIKN